MIWRAAPLIWAALSCALCADPVETTPYAQLRDILDGHVGFDTLPRRPEPGLNFDATLRFPGVWLGEHFAGMVLGRSEQGHDTPGTPPLPGRLQIRPGHAGQNLAVADHRGFGSNALFPLGPRGVNEISGRGEGAVAILFDHDQAALGLRVHSDYAAPLGNAATPGQLHVLFIARDGKIIFAHQYPLTPPITDLGWHRQNDRPDIAGVVIFNSDPGGIALDDLIFARIPPLG